MANVFEADKNYVVFAFDASRLHAYSLRGGL